MTLHKKILLVTDRDFLSSAKGNRQRIFSLMRCFVGLGCDVVLIAPPSAGLDRLPIKCHAYYPTSAPVFTGGDIAAFDSRPFSTAVRRASEECCPDIAIAVYAWLSPCLEATPATCIRVVDTHEVLYERTRDFTTFGLDPWLQCDPETERLLLLHADIVFANHHVDAASFRLLLGGSRKVICVPHSFDMDSAMHQQPSEGVKVMFIGSHHDGNLGIIDFLKKGWPRVRAAVPNSELVAYGSIGSKLSSSSGLHIAGVVDDLQLAYRETALVICPINVGGGLKVKTVEALANGRTIVGTSCAVSGMPHPNADIWQLADDWDAFAHAIVGLLQEPSRRHKMESEGYAYAQRYFSDVAVRQVIQNIVATQ